MERRFITNDGGQTMFEQLFQKSPVVARHQSAPFAEERASYLSYCAQRGETKRGLGSKARELIFAAELLGATPQLGVTIDQVLDIARRRADGRNGHIDSTEDRFVRNVRSWLRYLGWWNEPTANSLPFEDQLNQYCCWMRNERWLSEATIDTRQNSLKPFLRWCGQDNIELSDIQPNDVDRYFIHLGSKGWRRISLKNVAESIRSFLRYAESNGWSQPNVANSVQGPRIYQQEGLPKGQAWSDIHQMLNGMNTDCPQDIRDRAIVMLFAIYGLRASEAARLRLDDLDWEGEWLLIRRTKWRQAQKYPLLPSVGNAIIQYLEKVRPRSVYREIFLGLQSPHRPLGPKTGLYKIVSRRLAPFGVRTAHHGPHSLRHACANRLVAEGLSLKEIGDHLGHRRNESTRIYAKVDLAALREVAAFDLGELP